MTNPAAGQLSIAANPDLAWAILWQEIPTTASYPDDR